MEHSIDLLDDKPVQMQPYSALEVNRKFIKHEEGIIRPSRSPYASPVLVVDRPHHTSTPKRICVDYRYINVKTVKHAYPMPRTDDLLRKIAGSCYMTKLDIKKAFLIIRLKESDRSKAAFVTENEHYKLNRMLFGLCNAPATMQSVMQVHEVELRCRRRAASSHKNERDIP